jgi:anti-sigma B factor antagonist
MQISVTTNGDIRILAVSGRIDLYSAGSFYDALVEAVGDAQADLVIDLTAIARLTSAGMRGLVVAAKLQQSAGHAIRICCATAAIKKFLRGRGYDNLLRFEPTVEDAIKALSPAHGERAADMAQGVIGVRPLSVHPLDNADAGLTLDHILQMLHHENAQFFIPSRRLAPEEDGADLLQTDCPVVGRHLTRA